MLRSIESARKTFIGIQVRVSVECNVNEGGCEYLILARAAELAVHGVQLHTQCFADLDLEIP